MCCISEGTLLRYGCFSRIHRKPIWNLDSLQHLQKTECEAAHLLCFTEHLLGVRNSMHSLSKPYNGAMRAVLSLCPFCTGWNVGSGGWGQTARHTEAGCEAPSALLRSPCSSRSMEFKGNFKYYRDIGFHSVLTPLGPQGSTLAINSFRESGGIFFYPAASPWTPFFFTLPTLDPSTQPKCMPRPMHLPHCSWEWEFPSVNGIGSSPAQNLCTFSPYVEDTDAQYIAHNVPGDLEYPVPPSLTSCFPPSRSFIDIQQRGSLCIPQSHRSHSTSSPPARGDASACNTAFPLLLSPNPHLSWFHLILWLFLLLHFTFSELTLLTL